MKWFYNLRIMSKMIILVMFTGLFMSFVGFIGYYNSSNISEKMNEMYNDRLLPIKLLNEVRSNFRTVHSFIIESMLANVDKIQEQQMAQKTKELSAETDKIIADYEKGKITPFEQERLIKLHNAIQCYRSERQKAIAIAQTGQRQEAYNYFVQHGNQYVEEISVLLKELADYNTKASEEANLAGKNDAYKAKISIMVLTIVAVLLASIFGIFVGRMIARRLNSVVAVLNEIANGDITQNVKVTASDEIGQLGITLNIMREKLHNLVTQVAQTAEQVAASSEEITASSEQSSNAANQIAGSITDVAQGTQQQLKSVDESSAVIEEMSASIQQVASSSNAVAAMTDNTAKSAKDGVKAIEVAVDQMSSIANTVLNSAKVVSKLGERSKEIGQIVDTISGIAAQTNLLALNAAIEAARAGEQGKGFSVVAEEVRKLAEQSQDAAKQIAALISEIQDDTEVAVGAMKEGTDEVKVGNEVVDKAGKAFVDIDNLVDKVAQQVREISAAMQQMASGSQQIVTSVKEIDIISKDTAKQMETVSAATEEQSASIEEIAASSRGLSNLAQDLQTIISKFKI